MCTTLSHQSMQLGVVSMQLEFPPKIREIMNKDTEFRRDFIKAIYNVYN